MKQLLALFNSSAWLLIVPSLAVLWFVDQSMLFTLLQWTAFAIALAGITIVVSLLIFPQVDLGKLVRIASGGTMSSAIVAGALIVCFGLLFLSMVLWAKS